MSADPDPVKVLTTDAEVASWNTDGLPSDQVRDEQFLGGLFSNAHVAMGIAVMIDRNPR